MSEPLKNIQPQVGCPYVPCGGYSAKAKRVKSVEPFTADKLKNIHTELVTCPHINCGTYSGTKSKRIYTAENLASVYKNIHTQGCPYVDCNVIYECDKLCIKVVLNDVDYSIDLSELPAANAGSWDTANDRLVDYGTYQPWHMDPDTLFPWSPWTFGNTPEFIPEYPYHECYCRWYAFNSTCHRGYTYYLWPYPDPETGEWYLCLAIVSDDLIYYTYDPHLERTDVVFTKHLPAIYENCEVCSGTGVVGETPCEECDGTGQVISEETSCWWKSSLTHTLDYVRTVFPNIAPGETVPGTPDYTNATATITAEPMVEVDPGDPTGEPGGSGWVSPGVQCGDSPFLSWESPKSFARQYRMAYCPTEPEEFLNFIQLEIDGIKLFQRQAISPGIVAAIEEDTLYEGSRVVVTHEWPVTAKLIGRYSDSEGYFYYNGSWNKAPIKPQTVTIEWYTPYSTDIRNPDIGCVHHNPRIGIRTGVILNIIHYGYGIFSGGIGDPLPPAYDPDDPDAFYIFFIIPEGADKADPAYYYKRSYSSLQYIYPYTEIPLTVDDGWIVGVNIGDIFKPSEYLAWLSIDGTHLLDPPQTWENIYAHTGHPCNCWQSSGSFVNGVFLRAHYGIREVAGIWQVGWTVRISQAGYGSYSLYNLEGFTASEDCCPTDLAITRYWSADSGVTYQPATHWRFGAGTVNLSCVLVTVPPGGYSVITGKSELSAIATTPPYNWAELIGKSELVAKGGIPAIAWATLTGKSTLVAKGATPAVAWAVLTGKSAGNALGGEGTISASFVVWTESAGEQAYEIRLHTADPGVGGTANEYSGGNYWPEWPVWNEEIGGYCALSADLLFDGNPSDTVTYASLWGWDYGIWDYKWLSNAIIQGATVFDEYGTLTLLAGHTKYKT